MGDGYDEIQHELGELEERGLARQDSGAVMPLERLQAELTAATQARSVRGLQRVIGAATVAAEAQHRVAKLAAGEGSPQEVVKAAGDAANDAASVRLAAMTEVGRILREMVETGERAARGGDRRGTKPNPPTIDEVLGMEAARADWHSKRYQRLADVPDNVRTDYVDTVKERGGEVTTAGLLRYANPKSSETTHERDDLEVAYDKVVSLMGDLLRYDSQTLAAHANVTKRKAQFRKLMDRMRDWVERTDAIIQ
jgi:hypothetical protein